MNIKTAVHNRLMKIQGLLRQIYHKYRVVKRMKSIHQRKPRALAGFRNVLAGGAQIRKRKKKRRERKEKRKEFD